MEGAENESSRSVGSSWVGARALQAKDAVCQGRALCFRHQVEGRPQTLTQPELKFTSKTEDLQCGHGRCEP